MLKITLFKALHGDSFHVMSEEDNISFIIDCGLKKTYHQEIYKKCDNIDFLILTHIDEDHINGAIPLLQDYPKKFTLNKIYINTPSSYLVCSSDGDISIRQSRTLEDIIRSKNLQFESLKSSDKLILSQNLSIDVISPVTLDLDYFIAKYRESEVVKELPTPISKPTSDSSLLELSELSDSCKSRKSDFVNSSSIAFILKYKNKKILFLGDSHPEVIFLELIKMGYSAENKATFDYVKLSHHGSITSINNDLVSILRCNNFIISTNGGKGNSIHPSRETIAKLALKCDRGDSEVINFIFNYPLSKIESRNGKIATAAELREHKINLIEKNEIIIS